MNSSKEELIEMTELSPEKDSSSKPKKSKKPSSNATYSITSVSSATPSEEVDIVNIFSVNPKTYSRRTSVSDHQTISEISDDVFLVKPEPKQSASSSHFKTNYKEKITEHLKKIKEKATGSNESYRNRLPMERVRKESQQLDTEVDTVTSKFNRDNKRDKNDFFTYIEKKIENVNNDENNEDFFYVPPDKLEFSTKLAEKECFFYLTRKILPTTIKCGKAQPIMDDFPKIPDYIKNIIDQRFLALDDMKWYDESGNLKLLESPLTSLSMRPSSYQLNDPSTTVYIPSSTNLQTELTEVIIVKEDILNVYLSHIKFHHHPLFSAEDVMAEKLKLVFGEYTFFLKENVLEKLKKRLEELRQQNIDGDTTNDLKEKLKQTRNKYFKENKRYRELLYNILEAWKLLKQIRLKQGYSNTDIKLFVKKEKTDYTLENKEYKDMFEATVKEIANEDNLETEDDINESYSDEISQASSSKSKNKDAKLSRIKTKVRQIIKSSLKPPGEPKLIFALTQTPNDNVYADNIDNTKETSRRNVLSSTKFYLKILCNNIEVCKTKFLSLTRDYVLEIEEVFTLQLVDVPKYLVVEVHEQPKSLLKKKLCDIIIDVPQDKMVLQKRKSHFKKEDIIHYKHHGVGTGSCLQNLLDNYELELSNIKDYELNTNGYLEYEMEWENEREEKNEDYQSKIEELDQIVDSGFNINYELLKRCKELTGIQDFNINIDSERNFFRLSPQEVPHFCHISELEENVRLKILKLRDQKEIEFDGMLIPNRIKEIPLNVLSQYLKRKSGEKEVSKLKKTTDLKSYYYYGKKCLQEIHLRVFQLCKNTENNLDYDSVIDEKYFIYFHEMLLTLLRNFFNWFKWRPKISKPLPTLRKEGSEEPTNIPQSNLYLTVKILSGKNIPTRKKYTFNDEGNDINEICPFVEVNYKNIFAKTSTNFGSSPIWDETIIIPLESSHMDYLNPNSLDGVISINIFDESNIEISKLNKNCVNWIGGIDVLLSAVSCCDKMSGFFQIKLPYVLLDYETATEKMHKTTKNSSLQIIHTYLEMEISITPTVPKLSSNMEELPSGDLPYIYDHVLKWNKNFNDSYPHRKFNALVMDSNGKTTCITRFIRPLEPPQINTDEFDVSVEQCSRYVSLIPFTVSNHFYNNVWLSTEQLTTFMLGSVIDHAIALTCYLTALKLEVYLLLGYGIPHGNTAYVFHPEYNPESNLPIHYIIDVVYNEKYNILEDHCPLQKVYCVLNGKNVWANIQRTDNIALTRFDFNQNSDWLPLFDAKIPAPTNFVGNKVSYLAKEDTELLEIQLEKQLKRQIAKLRLLDRTVWNSGVSNVLSGFLKTFELNCMYSRSQHDSIHELRQEISQYSISGFALNMNFMSFSTLVKKIKKLGIHVQREKDIEFSLAVHIHSYPGRLFSVWIFLVNIRNSD